MDDGFILLELEPNSESIKRNSTESDLSMSKYSSIRDTFSGDQFKSMYSDTESRSPSLPVRQTPLQEPLLLENPPSPIDPNSVIESPEPLASPAISESSESQEINLFRVILGCAFPCWLSFHNPE